MAFHEFYVSTNKYGVKASDGTAFANGSEIISDVATDSAATSLAKGSIAIFNDKGILIADENSTDINDSTHFQFALGRGDQIPAWMSEPIPRTAKISYQIFSDKTTCVQYIGAEAVVADTPVGNLNVPSVLTQGSSAYIQLRFMDRLTNEGACVHAYSTEVRVGDSIEAILTRLITKMNSEKQFPITATIVDTDKGIKVETDENVSIAVGGILDYATVVTESTPNEAGNSHFATPGLNNYDKLLEWENKAYASHGDTNHSEPEQFKVFKQASELIDGSDYNVITLSFPITPPSIGEAIRRVQENSLMIAADLATDAGVGVGKMLTVIDPILTKIFGVDPNII